MKVYLLTSVVVANCLFQLVSSNVFECPPGSATVYLPHPTECNKFIECKNEIPTVLNCPTNFYWNVKDLKCDWRFNVVCPGDVFGEETTPSLDPPTRPYEPITSEIEIVRECDNYDGTNIAHPLNCSLFLACTDLGSITMICADGLYFNEVEQRCDDPQNVDCQWTTTEDPISTTTPITTTPTITPTTPTECPTTPTECPTTPTECPTTPTECPTTPTECPTTPTTECPTTPTTECPTTPTECPTTPTECPTTPTTECPTTPTTECPTTPTTECPTTPTTECPTTPTECPTTPTECPTTPTECPTTPTECPTTPTTECPTPTTQCPTVTPCPCQTTTPCPCQSTTLCPCQASSTLANEAPPTPLPITQSPMPITPSSTVITSATSNAPLPSSCSPMCINGADYLPSPTDCSKFIRCVFCVAYEMNCPRGLLWSKEKTVCDWSYNVKC